MQSPTSNDLKEQKKMFEPGAPKTKNAKSKLFKHIMNGLFSISLGTIIGGLAAPLAATTGGAILIGLGAAALILSISEACTCLCTDNSASNNLKMPKKKKLMVSVDNQDMTAHLLTRFANTTQPDQPRSLLSPNQLDTSKLFTKPLPWALAAKKKNKTIIPVPSLKRIVEDSEEEKECKEQEEEMKPSNLVEEFGEDEDIEKEDEAQLTSLVIESGEEEIQLTRIAEQPDASLSQIPNHRG